MFWTKPSAKNVMPKRVIDALQANFSDQELLELSRLATPVDVAEGAALTIEGTFGRQALVMVAGSASVLRDGNQIATLHAGDIVGEIALLTGERRTATVVADVDSTVYALSPREFSSLLARCPSLEKKVADLAAHRRSAA